MEIRLRITPGWCHADSDTVSWWYIVQFTLQPDAKLTGHLCITWCKARLQIFTWAETWFCLFLVTNIILVTNILWLTLEQLLPQSSKCLGCIPTIVMYRHLHLCCCDCFSLSWWVDKLKRQQLKFKKIIQFYYLVPKSVSKLLVLLWMTKASQ